MPFPPARRAAKRTGLLTGTAIQTGLIVGAAAALAVVAVVVGACGAEATGSGDSEEIPKIVLSQDSPDLTADMAVSPTTKPGTDMSDLTFDAFDGGTGTLGDYGGQPLVVNFFASWCPPCVREMPEFQAVFERLGGRVAFLGLSQDRAPEDALALVESTGVAYETGWDPDLEVYEATGSVAMPTTAFVSPTGELLDVFAGVLDAEALSERIERFLGVAARP